MDCSSEREELLVQSELASQAFWRTYHLVFGGSLTDSEKFLANPGHMVTCFYCELWWRGPVIGAYVFCYIFPHGAVMALLWWFLPPRL